jgi:hypothetical protein
MGSKNKDRFKLSSPQKSLLWNQSLTIEPSKAKQNNMISMVIRTRNECRLDLLEKAFNKLIEVNDGLRFVITRNLFRLYQQISEYKYMTLPIIKIKDMGEMKYALDEFSKVSVPFFGGKMYRAELIDIGRESGAIAMRFHHAVIDGYSIRLIIEQFTEYYESFCRDMEPEPKQYSILRWFEREREYSKSESHREDYKYWKYQFHHQPRFSLPAGRRSLRVETGYMETDVSGETYHKLMDLSRELSCTYYYILMCIAALTTYRLTEKTNFSIYSLNHGRFDAISKKTIGTMMNLVPIFFNLDTSQSFRQMTAKGYMDYLNALKHARFPVSEQIPLTFKESILHGFNFYHTWLIFSLLEHEGLLTQARYSPYDVRFLRTNALMVPLYCFLYNTPDEKVTFRLQYQKKKFKQEQVEKMLSTFMETAKLLLDDTDKSINQIFKAEV